MKIIRRFSDPNLLRKWIIPFVDGQCRIEVKNGDIFRGGIESLEVSGVHGVKKLTVKFEWLCRRGEIFDKDRFSRMRWYECQQTAKRELEISFTSFSKQPDEDRLKLRSTSGEIWHLFMSDDHTNLEKDEHDSFNVRNEILLRRILCAILINKSQKK